MSPSGRPTSESQRAPREGGPASLAVIVATYNRVDALRAVLAGLAAQTERGFEIVVADDGSGAATAAAVQAFAASAPVAVRHVWQEDCGFRLAMSRNRAVAAGAGEYLVFLDGDCVPRPDFVARHRALAEPGWVVAGHRMLLTEAFTRTVLADGLPIHAWTPAQWRTARSRGAINRLLPLYALPLGPLRKLRAQRWQRLRTCNVGVWRRDFETVNGFDEDFTGWGYEDSDFAVRLLHAGVRIKLGTFATGVLHLWHRENDRSRAAENWQRFQHRLHSNLVRAPRGYDAHRDPPPPGR